MIIDAENAVLGRLSSYAAKQALLGNKIIIVNSEKTIIQGREESILEKFNVKRARGGSGLLGPFIHVSPEKILKRTIRNMLPYNQDRGKKALKRILCYVGIPKEFEDKKMIKSGKGKKGMRLGKISKLLKGGRK